MILASRFSTQLILQRTRPSIPYPRHGNHRSMQRLAVNSRKKREVLDITDRVEEQLAKNGHVSGICHLLVLHTTAALTTADLDPGTHLDMLDAFEAMMPKRRYRHHHNPAHRLDAIVSRLLR